MHRELSIGILGKNSAWILKYSMQSLRAALDIIKSNNIRFEVLYVDGGSTDNSKDIVKDILGSSVKIIDATGTNIPEARNMVVKESMGDYIVFWDSDIIAPPHVLMTLINEDKPIISTVRTDVYINSETEISELLKKVLQTKPSDIRIRTVPYTVFGINLFKRDIFKDVGLFDERLTQAEDRDFGLRAMCHGYNSYLIENETVYDINKRLKSEVPVLTSLRQYLRGIHKKAAIYAYTGSRRQKVLGSVFLLLHILAITSLFTAIPFYADEIIPVIYQVTRYGLHKGIEMWIKSLTFYTMLGVVYPIVKLSDICSILSSW